MMFVSIRERFSSPSETKRGCSYRVACFLIFMLAVLWGQKQIPIQTIKHITIPIFNSNFLTLFVNLNQFTNEKVYVLLHPCRLRADLFRLH